MSNDNKTFVQYVSIFRIINYRIFEGKRKEIVIKLEDILNNKIITAKIMNTKKKRYYNSFIDKVINPGAEYVIGVLKEVKYGNKTFIYLNSPYIPLTKEDVKTTIDNIQVLERTLEEYAEDRGLKLIKNYGRYKYIFVYWLVDGYIAIRVGVPLVRNKALWLMVYYYNEEKEKWVNITDWTNVRVKKWGRAPEGRIYHNNTKPHKDLLERLDKLFEKARKKLKRMGIEKGYQTKIDAFIKGMEMFQKQSYKTALPI